MKKTIFILLALIIVSPTLIKASCDGVYGVTGSEDKLIEVTCKYEAKYNKRVLFVQTGTAIARLTMKLCCPRNVQIGDVCYIQSLQETNDDGSSNYYNGSFYDSFPVAGHESGCMNSIEASTNWYDHFFSTEHPDLTLVECDSGDDFCYRLTDYDREVVPIDSGKYDDIVSCRDADYKYIKECGCMPASLTDLTSRLYMLIKIAAPALLLVIGGFDLIKAMSAQDEKAINKARQKLVKKFIAAAAVFLIFTLIQFIVSTFANNVTDTMKCLDYLLNGYVA